MPDILGVGRELAGAQQQREAGAGRIVGRRLLRKEDGFQAGLHRQQPDRHGEKRVEQRADHWRAGEGVVPRDAGGPGPGHRGDEHQPIGEVGLVEREGDRQRAGP